LYVNIIHTVVQSCVIVTDYHSFINKSLVGALHVHHLVGLCVCIQLMISVLKEPTSMTLMFKYMSMFFVKAFGLLLFSLLC